MRPAGASYSGRAPPVVLQWGIRSPCPRKYDRRLCTGSQKRSDLPTCDLPIADRIWKPFFYEGLRGMQEKDKRCLF